jgi:hypothetical protein
MTDSESNVIRIPSSGLPVGEERVLTIVVIGAKDPVLDGQAQELKDWLKRNVPEQALQTFMGLMERASWSKLRVARQ